MTPEFWAIIAVGVALATLTLNGHRRLNALLDRHLGRLDRDMAGLHERLDRDIAGLHERLDRDIGRLDRDIVGVHERLDRDLGPLHKRMDRLEERMDRHAKELGERIGRVEVGVADVRERVAYVEGLLEGLRDALVGKGHPEPPRPRRVGG